MKTATTSNTLAGFKFILQSAMVNGIYFSTKVTNDKGEIVRETQPSPVGIVQSNSFALNRNGQMVWTEFGKASQWEFDLSNGKAIKLLGKDRLIYQFNEPGFFDIK
jgi:hypothetical protein